jgi:hypothetical protein
LKGKKGKQGSGGDDDEGTPAPENGKIKKKLAPNTTTPRSREDAEEALNGGEVKNAGEIGLVIQDDDD